MTVCSHLRTIYWLSRRSLTSRQLTYAERGDPLSVVHLESKEISDSPQPSEVLVRWLASPVNPSDVSQIQGTYAVKPPMPAVCGNEGCGRVEKVGNAVKSVAVGDTVIPARSGLGTWRTFGLHGEAEVFGVDKRLDRKVAAMLQVNPSTAYRMLTDFADLREGDTVVQNGSNSAVGRYVIQICRIRGIRTVNVIRDTGEDRSQLKEELKSLGANEVVTEKEFSGIARSVKNVKLALNCTGGRITATMAAMLQRGGHVVTYGAMSRQLGGFGAGPLIFNRVKLVGFWMSDWYDEGNVEERTRMYKQLADWYREGLLQPTTVVERSLDEYKEVLDTAMNTSEKQMFIIE